MISAPSTVELVPSEPRFEFEVNKHEIWRGFLVMTRWLMVRTPWFRIGVHQMHPDTAEDALHNHATGFWSIILWGSYEESVWDGFEWLPNQLRDIVPDPHTVDRPPDRVHQRRSWIPRWVSKEEVHAIRQTSRRTYTLVLSAGTEVETVTAMGGGGGGRYRPLPWRPSRPGWGGGISYPEPSREPDQPQIDPQKPSVPDETWKE